MMFPLCTIVMLDLFCSIAYLIALRIIRLDPKAEMGLIGQARYLPAKKRPFLPSKISDLHTFDAALRPFYPSIDVFHVLPKYDHVNFPGIP